MSNLLAKFTDENLTYAKRAQAMSGRAVLDSPARLFENLEPGLKVHSVFESYERNFFLCEHPDAAGWTLIEVASFYDHRGVAYPLSHYGGEGLKSHLFEEWLNRPAPRPLTTLFDEWVEGVCGHELTTTADNEYAPLLMLLRVEGRQGDALRTMIGLGRWEQFDMREVDPKVMTEPIENLTIRYVVKKIQPV